MFETLDWGEYHRPPGTNPNLVQFQIGHVSSLFTVASPISIPSCVCGVHRTGRQAPTPSSSP